ncbi:uncharacterized protein RHO25_002237 [Cercospora beticola]|uniref:Uncharacterized protein n=1 Tax=Cercospora beticola TaxID=122368 RepID=A0ABZ0NDN3_CERBT|nr:hypothetical protein RHO25_002237 [Cercospora beticola]
MSSQNAFEPVQEWIFVETEPKSAPSQGDKKLAHRKRIRAQAAKVSSNARLETIRKRVPKRTTQPVEHVFQVALSGGSGQRRQLRPLASACEERESEVLAAQYRGPIPVAQANAAILSQFLSRFKSGGPAERPWIELVMARAVSSSTPSLISTALQANASALCANDLQHPEISQHATKLYFALLAGILLLVMPTFEALHASYKRKDPKVSFLVSSTRHFGITGSTL